MRLLIYGINYSPEPTGIGPYTTDMARWFKQRGHEVEIITALPHYPAWKVDDTYIGKGLLEEELDGITIHRAPLITPNGNPPSAANRILLETSFSLASIKYWLLCLLRKAKYDAVIAICPPLQLGIYPLLYGRLRKVPWVFHVQDLQVDAAFRLGVLGRSASSRILYWIENALLKRATRVSTITESMRRRIVAKGIEMESTLVLPNWADVSHILPRSRENSFRESLEIGSDKLLYMYSGTMGAKQGLEIILDVARTLQSDERFQFVLVGDGAKRQELENAAQQLDNVSFVPVQPKERLNEVLAAADVHFVIQKRNAADLVMPSKLGNIMAAGRAVIATAEEGTALHEAVSLANAGIATAPEDHFSLVSAILHMASSVERREAYGRRARRWAEEHLSMDPILQEFEKHLENLISARTEF